MNDERCSEWTGAVWTAVNVAEQIYQRWGAQAVKEYDPTSNCFTLRRWNQMGYRVRRGEKSLHSYTFIRATEKNQDGKEVITAQYPKTVHLFSIQQVEKVDGPLAVCGSVIADAFGMRDLPNVQVIEEAR